MATSAGELIYTVGMDTKGLLTGAKQTQAEVSKTGAAMEQAGNQAAKLSTKMTGTAQSVNQATSSMGKAGSAAQQFGYQIQDMAVQLQGGTNALTVIGQQGSQLAAVFGPTGALIGAIIAVAAAIGTSLVGATEKASDSFDDLITKIDKLSAAQKEFISIQLGERVRDDSKSIAELNQRIATLNNYQRTYGSLTEGQARDLAELKSAHDTLTQSIDDANKQLSTINDSHTKNIKKTKEAEEAYRDLAGQLGVEVEALKSGDKAAAIMAANIRLGSAATKEQKDKIATLISSVFDLKAAKEAQDKAQKSSASSAKSEQRALESNEQKITSAKLKTQQLTVELANLKNGTEEITGTTSRYSIESATLAAQQQLNKDATKQQVAALAEQILAQQRINEEIANQSKISKQTAKFTEFVTEVETDATLKADDPNKTETKKHLANLRRINAFSKMEAAATAEGKRLIHQAEVEEETRHQKELAQIRQDALLSSLDFVSSSTSNILTMLSDAGKESSAMYKILFAAQKAAAIPSMLVATEEGATKALALGPIAGPAMSNIIRGLGYASMGVVAGQAIAGARQFGGQTDAGGIYRLGENNQPEVWKTSAGMFGVSGDRGSVTPLSDMQGGGFQQSVSVHNYGNSQVSTRTSPDGKQMDVIINEIASQVEQRRGRFARAMTSGTNTKFKAR